MLDLDSPRWASLSHAYGDASDIPPLLRSLEAQAFWINEAFGQIEPWFSLWSSLCHQGDAYTASYAAVPHLLRTALNLQGIPDWQYFALPASVEIARSTGNGPSVPEDLQAAYDAAFHHIHELAYRLAGLEWDELLSRSIAGALVVSKGHRALGETILELSPQAIQQFHIQ